MRVRDQRTLLGLVYAVTLTLTSLVCVACAPKGTPVDPGTRAAQPGAQGGESALPAWFPHAVDVRVHPASRYVIEREDLRLEARIELLDQFNEPIKDIGQLVVELRLLDENGKLVLDADGRQRGFRWEFDLSTEQSQRDHWDPIARAYNLPLKIDAREKDLPKFRTVLRVTFDPVWPEMPTLPTSENARQPVEIRTDW